MNHWDRRGCLDAASIRGPFDFQSNADRHQGEERCADLDDIGPRGSRVMDLDAYSCPPSVGRRWAATSDVTTVIEL